MNIDSRDEGQIAVLKMSGVLRMGPDTQKLRQAVNQLVDQGKNQILLDIEDLSYIDSSGTIVTRWNKSPNRETKRFTTATNDLRFHRKYHILHTPVVGFA